MKINVRAFLISFIVTTIVSVTTAVIIYQLANQLLIDQQKRTVASAARELSFSVYSSLADLDNEFLSFKDNINSLNTSELANSKLDFVFKLDRNNFLDKDYNFFKIRKLFKEKLTLSGFLTGNPNALLKSYYTVTGEVIYYGIFIDNIFLDELSGKIKSEVGLVVKDFPFVVSGSEKNQDFMYILSPAVNYLNSNPDEIFYSNANDKYDFFVVKAMVSQVSELNEDLSFIIFIKSEDTVGFRNTISRLLIIIVITGVAISVILVLLLTYKLRNQIYFLNEAVESIKKGSFEKRAKVISKDELGSFAGVFNQMLDNLEKNEATKRDYLEFISLINSNPSLKELSEVALKSIRKATESSVGLFYVVEDGKFQLTASVGIDRDLTKETEPDLFQNLLHYKQPVEYRFRDNTPQINTGLLSINVKYMLIFPIIFNSEVIGVIEIASIEEPEIDVKDYFTKLHSQLSIGLSNAKAYRQMERYVSDLRRLNDIYQNQNLKITEQNRELIELHNKVKEKAEELKEQKEKAMEMTKLKSQFLANMSHELRTPLNSILGLTEIMLNNESSPANADDKLRIILRNGNRLLNIINNILEYSKLEAGRIGVHKEEFSLNNLLLELESYIVPLLHQKPVELKIYKLKNNFSLTTDKTKIIQILLNLVSNSVKFTERGKIEVVTKLIENRILNFKVIDTGIGISEEDQKVIFDEFIQAENKTSGNSGSGLGLSICRRYTEMLKGSLNVESNIGHGSTFTFSVPVDDVKQTSNEISETTFNRTANGNSIKKAVIFTNEDEQTSFIKDHLQTLGYKISLVPTQIDFESVINITPELLIIYINHPATFETLARIKRDKILKHIPLYSIVNYSDKNYILPVNEILLKPLGGELFEKTVLSIERETGKKINNVLILDNDQLIFEKFLKEDNINNRRINYLKESAYAFNHILEYQPGLILIDLLLSGKNFISLLSQLKKNNQTNSIPVILTIPENISDGEIVNLLDNFQNLKESGFKEDLLIEMLFKNKHIKKDGKFTLSFSTMEVINNISEEPEEEPDIINKILIVDDDEDTLYTVREILVNLGYETLVARNGFECLSVLENERPRLILLDIMMPEMDGFETVKRIRADKRLDELTVFALSAKAMMEEKDILLRNGFNDFIPKPVNRINLAFKLEQLFKKSPEEL